MGVTNRQDKPTNSVKGESSTDHTERGIESHNNNNNNNNNNINQRISRAPFHVKHAQLR